MREAAFEIYLKNDPAINSAAAVAKRMNVAAKAEEILGKSLDVVVGNDDTMYESLLELQKYEDPAHNPMQNAVRKYYKFINEKEFPQKRHYHSAKHP